MHRKDIYNLSCKQEMIHYNINDSISLIILPDGIKKLKHNKHNNQGKMEIKLHVIKKIIIILKHDIAFPLQLTLNIIIYTCKRVHTHTLIIIIIMIISVYYKIIHMYMYM